MNEAFSTERFNEIRHLYVNQMVENMDLNSLIEFAYDTMYSNLENYSDEQLVEEIADYDVDFLRDDVGIDVDAYFSNTSIGLTK